MQQSSGRGITATFVLDAIRPAALSWPSGVSARELGIDLLWVLFLVGASGMNNLPIDIGALQALVWFPADLAALVVAYAQRERFLALARRNLLLLTWPLLAMISTIWSLAPAMSLYHGAQLLMTVMVGIMLSLYANLLRVLQLSFVALFVCSLLSLLYVLASPTNAMWPTGEWTGLFRHKNTLGSAMAGEVIIGVCLFLQGWRPAFTAAGTILAGAMMMMTRSGTVILAVVMALSPLLLVFMYRKGREAFLFAIGVLLSAGTISLLYAEVMHFDVVNSILGGLGKDSTLTGRTILWEFGVDAFNERPWLGFGYKGWWYGEGTAAPVLRMVVEQELWMFHNNFLEVAIAFGILGPIALVAVILFAIAVSVRAFLVDPQYIRAWPIFFLLFTLFLSAAENPLFNNHGLSEVMLVAICSVGMPRKA